MVPTDDSSLVPAPSAVVLFSGGLDSTTLLHIARRDGFEVHAISFDYGQRHAFELVRARQIAEQMAIEQVVVKLDMRPFGGSALTGDIAVPKGRSVEQMSNEIPVTYVPARNTVFLALALAYAESRGACDLFIGVNALDYSGYPDCRPAFIEAFQRMARLATKAGVEGKQITVHTPLINLTKAQIIDCGMTLGVDYANTISCYDPSATGAACGRCDACMLRKKGFDEAGVADPTEYEQD